MIVNRRRLQTGPPARGAGVQDRLLARPDRARGRDPEPGRRHGPLQRSRGLQRCICVSSTHGRVLPATYRACSAVSISRALASGIARTPPCPGTSLLSA